MPDRPAAPLGALRERLAEVADLGHAAAVLEWDQETYMPPGGADGRAHQIATLRRLAHERFADDAVDALLAAADDATDALADDHPDRALVRVTRRDFARATRLPSALIAAQAEARSHALEAWKAAREADAYAPFAPHLQRIVDLAAEQADLLRPLLAEERGPGWAPSDADARYDALLDAYEPEASTTALADLFAALRARLVPLVEAVAARPQLDDAPLHGAFPEDAQWAFGMRVAEALGYDLTRGRQDRSAHPFTTSFGTGDVRVTTRLDPAFFPTAFFGTVHEVGHALYEQGFDAALARTPLADAASLGLHESQSRLWENLVARALPFWTWAAPLFHAAFPGTPADADALHRAVNRVAPSLIRVEADELTYHLHVLLRFEIERELVAGRLAAADVPEAWNARMEAYLGLTPPSDADGCLQDINWALGAVGYFPTYTLGTLMSVPLYEAARRALAADGHDPDALLARGDFAPLLAWLRAHVHRHGRTRSAAEIVEAATGAPLSAEPWLAYAEAKFGALYGL